MSDEDDVREATLRFYDALEHLLCGKGVEPMKALWAHGPDVTIAHPIGDWAYGWDEVAATWDEFGALGVPSNVGSTLRDLRVHVHGDMAYTTAVYTSAPAVGSVALNVTNVLKRAPDGWRMVHHHADKAAHIEALIEETTLAPVDEKPE